MGVFESAWVIARRDFIATVYSRVFILFMLAPLLIFGVTIFFAQAQGRADREAVQSNVALLLSQVDTHAVANARDELAQATSQLAFPKVTAVPPDRDTQAQARHLLSDEQANYSAVLIGELDRPTLVGPARADDAFGPELRLIIERARAERDAAAAGRTPEPVAIERITTDNAVGNLRSARHQLARFAQLIIFVVTMSLATMLVSNFIDEKSNKIIEVLAAAVPLDAVFLGKLIATLGIAIVGLTFWGGLAVLAYVFMQVVQDWVQVPTGPAIGWPAFLILLPLYFACNFLLFGAVFLGIGSQAASTREVQTISMPIVIVQVLVMLLAGTTVSAQGDSWVAWFAYIFPLSSPMSMAAHAVQYDTIWPHLLALAWQAAWVFLFVRGATMLFRRFVMKSGGPVGVGAVRG